MINSYFFKTMKSRAKLQKLLGGIFMLFTYFVVWPFLRLIMVRELTI